MLTFDCHWNTLVLCILWSLFSKQSWAQTKKHVHPPDLPRLHKSIWFQCNTIQLWWLKLYVHRQNRIIDSQTHMLDVLVPQISLSKQFWFQKPGQLPFVVAKTPCFRTQAMHKTPFSALSGTGEVPPNCFLQPISENWLPKKLMVHHVSQDSVHWGIPTAIPQSCVFENKLRPNLSC